MAGEASEGEGTLRTIACFFALGSLVLLYKQIFAVATQDILTGSDISSSTVVLAGALPELAVKLVFPWFAARCSYLTRTIAVVSLQIGGLLAIVLSSIVEWRLVGVAFAAAGNSLGEITFLALTSFYENVTTSAFAAGLGTGSVLGPFWYTGGCQSLNPRLLRPRFKSTHVINHFI